MNDTSQESAGPGGSRFLYAAVFVISAIGIAYQVALMRTFSIAQWHHFAYMVISIAMMGFGASGTLLTLLRARLAGQESSVFAYTLVALAVSLPLCYVVSQRVPFETFHLVTQKHQLGWLFALYAILAVPFFLVSTCIALAFFMRPGHVGRIYFVDLIGSGLGAAVIVGLLFVCSPETLPYALSVPLWLLAAWPLRDMGRVYRAICVTAFVVVVTAALWVGVEPINVSQYKLLSYTRQFPESRVVEVTQSPLAQMHVVESPQLRETPGQLGNYPYSRLGPLPEQRGLFFDAGSVSVVHRHAADSPPFAFLEYVTPALVYQVVTNPVVLVVGAGGGTDVWMALQHGAHHVTAVEVDPSVFTLMAREPLASFSGHLYARPDVTPVTAEGRGYMRAAANERYDVIHIALLDAFNAAASGVYALSESYLYTKEAVALFRDHLTDHGVLATTRWLKAPPRDAIKLFATLVEACVDAGVSDPGAHLAFIRSWNTGTILLSRSPWTSDQIAAMRDFSRARGFDVVWLPDVTPDEVNQFTVLEEPHYYNAAVALLSDGRDAFYREFLFDVRPATDDRPYFFQFFKWDTLPRLVREMGFEWVPFVEWGYVALIATIAQGAVASAIFILLPLLVLARRPETRGARRWVVTYFSALGLAFMFLEIAFIQRFMLFLAYPIYAVAVVLAGFLIFSGCGSLIADRWTGSRHTLVGGAVGGIVVLTAAYVLGLPPLFAALGGWSDAARIGVSLVLIAPLAFCMGIPFPAGLQVVSNRYSAMVPWAWGVNGFASVMGASLATLTAIHFGFRVLVWAAALIYVAAWWIFRQLNRAGD